MCGHPLSGPGYHCVFWPHCSLLNSSHLSFNYLIAKLWNKSSDATWLDLRLLRRDLLRLAVVGVNTGFWQLAPAPLGGSGLGVVSGRVLWDHLCLPFFGENWLVVVVGGEGTTCLVPHRSCLDSFSVVTRSEGSLVVFVFFFSAGGSCVSRWTESFSLLTVVSFPIGFNLLCPHGFFMCLLHLCEITKFDLQCFKFWN